MSEPLPDMPLRRFPRRRLTLAAERPRAGPARRHRARFALAVAEPRALAHVPRSARETLERRLREAPATVPAAIGPRIEDGA